MDRGAQKRFSLVVDLIRRTESTDVPAIIDALNGIVPPMTL